MEAVKSGHGFSSTCLTKIDTKLILFSDVMGGRAGMHKHNSLQGMRPRCSGMCHLFLAVRWWVCSEAWLECGPGSCVCLHVCLGPETCRRILEQYISAPGSTHTWDLLR